MSTLKEHRDKLKVATAALILVALPYFLRGVDRGSLSFERLYISGMLSEAFIAMSVVVVGLLGILATVVRNLPYDIVKRVPISDAYPLAFRDMVMRAHADITAITKMATETKNPVIQGKLAMAAAEVSAHVRPALETISLAARQASSSGDEGNVGEMKERAQTLVVRASETRARCVELSVWGAASVGEGAEAAMLEVNRDLEALRLALVEVQELGNVGTRVGAA